MRVFEIPDGPPGEVCKRQERFVKSLLFTDATDAAWLESMNALFFVFGQQLLRSDDPWTSMQHAIETLQYMQGKVNKP